ncbi:NAD-dependent epimerase/dehydratase family protein [Paraliobacillus sp. JSM ZJ581]|uniref:NAD-dependent epimerase/dehydratase family protein n=1 Tax=Paraliobacillus sp. JSM ZJ581 TaxID=3342118 RepID=UPI0035A970D2
MNNSLHVVLGASGATGQAVIEELKRLRLNIRAVTRNTKVEGIETFSANLLDESEALTAISGATHAYLCVSLTSSTKAWSEQWPKVMKNVINACEKSNTKLIFIDNTYMYGPQPFLNPIDESHPQRPIHQKGFIRKNIADMLLRAHEERRISAVIGRSAVFYGTTSNSMMYILFLENLLKGEAPKTFGDINVKHNYAFVSDNGRALVKLALDDNAYGQVWHLPTSRPISLNEVNAIFNKLLGTQAKLSCIPKYVVSIISIFMPSVKEMRDMLNTYEADFVLSSNRFMTRYPDFQVTPIEEGLTEMINYNRRYSNVHIDKTKKNSEMILGQNYDFYYGHGLILTNNPYVSKAALTEESSKENLFTEENRGVKWKSKYGSVTFNQFGRELPTCGINEAGLSIASMWHNSVQKEIIELEKPLISELQWIQMQLDLYATIDEVEMGLSQYAYSVSLYPMHYHIVDRTGKSAIVEMINGKLQLLKHKDITACGNAGINESIEYFKRQ